MSFLKIAKFWLKAAKQTIFLIGKKSVAGFFQTEAIPSALWNACDYVLLINLKIALIGGSGFTNR